MLRIFKLRRRLVPVLDSRSQVVKRAHYMAAFLTCDVSKEAMTRGWYEQLCKEPCVVEALEEDYASKIPGTRGWSGEVRTPEHEVMLLELKQGAQSRIKQRRDRS